jgi:hypothetical protein
MNGKEWGLPELLVAAATLMGLGLLGLCGLSVEAMAWGMVIINSVFILSCGIARCGKITNIVAPH